MRGPGLRRIGIDEISFRKGHRYLTLVVDHQTGRLLWAAEGRDEETLGRFFIGLGRSRYRRITHVSADGAWWITNVARFYCPRAVIGLDPFHAVSWAACSSRSTLSEVHHGRL